jgi:hypothetical protein
MFGDDDALDLIGAFIDLRVLAEPSDSSAE